MFYSLVNVIIALAVQASAISIQAKEERYPNLVDGVANNKHDFAGFLPIKDILKTGGDMIKKGVDTHRAMYDTAINASKAATEGLTKVAQSGVETGKQVFQMTGSMGEGITAAGEQAAEMTKMIPGGQMVGDMIRTGSSSVGTAIEAASMKAEGMVDEIGGGAVMMGSEAVAVPQTMAGQISGMAHDAAKTMVDKATDTVSGMATGK